MVDLACLRGLPWEEIPRAEAVGRRRSEDSEVAVAESAADENLRGLPAWPFHVLPGCVALALSRRRRILYDLVTVVWTIFPQKSSCRTVGNRVGQYKLPARLAYGCVLPTSRADGIEL